MSWKVRYKTKELGEKILNLPKECLAKYLSLVDVILKYGPDPGIPQIKTIGEDIYQLRFCEDNIEVTIFYYVSRKKEIIVNDVIKKSI